MDIKLELVAVPVTDIDRAKAFYERVGFRADHDVTVSEDIRFVQLTPPGSACSIALGKGLTRMAPGSLDNMQVVVTDIEEAYEDLRGRGIEVTEIQDMPWGSFVYFSDPDGNGWAVQQTTPRTAAAGVESGAPGVG
ncbi:VOC family protein [Streptomyces sp. NBC_01343]|uniref:VOC family protein n=1 Tax=Streptomyces sp. NBC_01343 TaxID=2903832 RepID=UPI002E150FF1|nr:VOC family protein [Streptomyces sp. NBC_01343]